ncbi:MAG: bifunctional phosphoribosylaminoimidazolecarboxamide formyltransferase/IMP cyclohydrolase [Bacteroidales bacterium]|nr:bifunctional phosphoribosylaminoimidazolecarboxamide formyltransferase/IMP cyclohydrolase [Bacteroidales bacterium]MDY6348538.1 bifunctional phosphoribosylaminoimidazolecarboxamide formyltransferase/IMP cyclohydrolase [Bacteroidales bacterium]
MKKRRAIISVSDKEGIVPFAKGLADLGFEIISTGGTRKTLDAAGIPTIGISDVTGFPEIMDGRVKTLHPKVHGGLLSVRTNAGHVKEMDDNGIEPIDMVVVNLYPFRQTIEKPGTTFEDAIENIDIGGPSMLRSAAKNHAFVTVVVDCGDYSAVLSELEAHGDTTLETRRRLAAKVFRHTAAYDSHIAAYLTEKTGEQEPESLTLTFARKQSLRYGENPHQSAAFYAGKKQGYSVAWAEQLHGKELSYNNIQDADAALQILREFDAPTMVAVKHKNPCGVGVGATALEAWTRAYEADSVSIFGGIVASNREIDLPTAEAMKPVFLEIILAPSFSKEALDHLSAKKNIRLMTFSTDRSGADERMYVSVAGGLLCQSLDRKGFDDYELNVVTEKKPTAAEMENLRLAMTICKHVRSNAITVACDGRIAGIGAGQMNRVGAAHIALEEAKSKGLSANLCLASDAFFPFDDVVKMAAEYGVTAIIQPGGSVRDEDSIKACNDAGISMVFTGVRHFKH